MQATGLSRRADEPPPEAAPAEGEQADGDGGERGGEQHEVGALAAKDTPGDLEALDAHRPEVAEHVGRG